MQADREFLMQNSRFKNEEEMQERLEELEALLQSRSEQLMESGKLATLGKISLEIAHEIRNPLTAITGFVELLDELIVADKDLKEDARSKMCRFTNTIRHSSSMIGEILNSLKTYSRDASNDPFNSASVADFVRHAVELCQFNLTHKSILFEVDEIAADLKSECRATQLCQVLVNLLNNAMDAVAPLSEKWIKLQVKDLGESVQLSVMDSGRGIDPGIVEMIYAPFFSTKEPNEGTGLGLSICKAILDEHRGQFYVDTECRNTRFVLEIPKAHVAEEKSSGLKKV
jgi:C4-dicarboxylate-specific signal transduction histidine kinase